jgi:hypothetical protein
VCKPEPDPSVSHLENLENRDFFEGLGVDLRIPLKWILKEIW